MSPVVPFLEHPIGSLTLINHRCKNGIMVRTQIQFPVPLYLRLKTIAEQQDWSLDEDMRKAAEHFVTRFPETPAKRPPWTFPTLDCGGDFVSDPAAIRAEAEAIHQRSVS